MPPRSPGIDTDLGISLTADDALVLFEFLSRYSDTDELSIEDQAEQQVLWKLHGHLQRQLVAPFSSDYNALLAAARARLRNEGEETP